jgi:hypothetical protein
VSERGRQRLQGAIRASEASNQILRIARSCPGRTNELTRFSSVSERGRQRLQGAIRASEASNQILREPL